MLYLIKAFYSFLLPPGSIILLLAGLSVYFWRRSDRAFLFTAVTTLLLYCCSMPIISDILLRSLETRYLPPERLPAHQIWTVRET